MNRNPPTKWQFCVVVIVLHVFQIVVPSFCSECDQVFSFGYNAYGQIGDGTTTNSNVPVAVSTSGVLNGMTIIAIAGGDSHSLVLSSTGQVFSFGHNGYGQLGDGTNTARNVPVAVDSSGVLNGLNITAISAGSYHSLVLSSTGQVFSFGWNAYGQLGDGTTTNRWLPIAVNLSVLNDTTITAIAAGWIHSLVLSATGQVFSFGYNQFGRLGDGTGTTRLLPVAVITSGVLNGLNITAIAGGEAYSLVLADSRVFGFGYNDGQLGDGTNSVRPSPVATRTTGVLNGKNLTAISAGHTVSLVLSSNGEVFSFGVNEAGELGDGTTTKRLSPVAVDTSGALNGTTIAAIFAGGEFSLVLSSSGQVFSFGKNNYGQLGDGTNTDRWLPVAVNTSGLLNGKMITAIAGGRYHSLVLGIGLGNASMTSPLPYLIVGQTDIPINWCGPGNVTIELIRDGNETVDLIASNWGEGPPFLWANVSVSDARRSDFRFRISSETYPNNFSPDTSEAFEIELVEKHILSANVSFPDLSFDPMPQSFGIQMGFQPRSTRIGETEMWENERSCIESFGRIPVHLVLANVSDAPRSDFKLESRRFHNKTARTRAPLNKIC